MANKIILCKTCGAEIAANAKTCPKCGAKNKRPIYKKWWFYAILVLLFFGIVGGSQGDKTSSTSSESNVAAAKAEANVSSTAKAEQKPVTTPEPVSYTHYNVTELFDALKANAMKAQDTFKGQYVELEGFLGTIDSDGKYIGLGAEEGNYDYLFQEVQCYIKSNEQKNIIMEMNKGDHMIIRGKITNVGEIIGYSLNIDSIG